MRVSHLLKPGVLGFVLKNAWHGLVDKITGQPARPTLAAAYVAHHAERGNPADVLRTLDRFAREERWLMSVGPDKGPLVSDLRSRLPESPKILELGAYCGYSSIMMAHLLGPSAAITSVEISGECVAAARANIEVAGLATQVEVLESASGAAIPALRGPFDLVFLDHWKPLYLEDLQAIEAHELLRPGAIVVADNVGEIFGAGAFLDYVRNCGRYRCEHREATIEYTGIPDAVEIAEYIVGQ